MSPPLPQPRLALTGATGRVAALVRPFLDTATWLTRQDGFDAIAGADALICLAGVTRGDRNTLSNNTKTALEGLEAGARLGVPHVLILSSAAVYGRAPSPLRADKAPTPAAPYGEAKAQMEAAVTGWCSERPGGPRVTILRLGNVAGADALLGNISPDAPPTLDTWPDGRTPRRSYIGPRSLAHVFCKLAVCPDVPPILNVAAPGTVEMADLLQAAQRPWTTVPAPPEAIADVTLDTAPLSALIPLPAQAATAQGMVDEWQEALA
ncbi:epimerase [Jannaschia pagri]|uniref:Epimerase n=1 Tax=Jannaschia pagri TaxID=2829797 RepID=A0ABQ4NQ18_9RHOB|nr:MULTISPECIES: NAD-dependent epimerase/dehydratase family protein [unclassified Jannaschia]GIT92632.1 epimerase [Jannaschia sp. AI_61]GIT96508.1 epimerase [Jannaschia sp. AI_62]